LERIERKLDLEFGEPNEAKGKSKGAGKVPEDKKVSSTSTNIVL
jgi:hypothetical protein